MKIFHSLPAVNTAHCNLIVRPAWHVSWRTVFQCQSRCDMCVWYCRTGEGVQWNSIGRGVSVDDNFALLHVILMLLLDCVIYACIAWYVEAVYPGEYGVPRPFYFPLLVSCPFMRVISLCAVSLVYCCITSIHCHMSGHQSYVTVIQMFIRYVVLMVIHCILRTVVWNLYT